MSTRTPFLTILTLLGFACASLWLFSSPATAQLESGVEYTFGDSVTFRKILDEEQPIEQVNLSFGVRGESNVRVANAEINGNKVTYTHDLSADPLRAFSTIDFWYTLYAADGTQIELPHESFYYEDNRFAWNSLTSGSLSAFWYHGDQALGQSVIDVAEEGIQHAQEIITAGEPQTIKIYVYASSADMQAALGSNGRDWVVGHADPGLAVVVVALPEGPDQRLLSEQRIPHELMHVLLYQKTGLEYSNLPAWLNEGLASIAELYPDPDYQVMLENAKIQERLIPLESLCVGFPSDSYGAPLAYAESAYFVRYLYREHGSQALENLIAAYQDNLSCTRGVEATFGKSLQEMEKSWLEATFAEEKPPSRDLSGLLPWAVVLTAALGVPFVITIASLKKR